MPNYTSRLNIPLPLGNENVTRAAYITALNALESNASAVVDLSAHKTANPADHPAGSISDTLIGTRTVDQTQAPTNSNTPSFVGLILSQLANRVKAASGTTNWSDAPPVSLSAINTALRFTGAATTTQAALTVTGALTVTSTTTLGGIAYTWPGSQTASYYLQTNGTGTLSWAAVPPGITVAGTAAQVLVNGGTAGVNSGTATLSLATSGTLPGNWTLNSPTINGTVAGGPTFGGGPHTTDWWYVNTNGYGIYSSAASFGISFTAGQVGPGFYGGTFSGTLLVSDTGTQTLSNKMITNLKQQSGSGYITTGGDLTNYMFDYGTTLCTLPTPSATYTGVFRAFKAWGGALSVNCAVAQIAAPGGTGMVSSFSINNGDSVTLWCDGTYWWAL